MKTRACSKCGHKKPRTLEFFGPQQGAADGMHSHCRLCRRIEARERKQQERAQTPLGADVGHGPGVPIERTTIAPGVTRVQFGRGWKPTRDSHTTPGLLGYRSPLTRIF